MKIGECMQKKITKNLCKERNFEVLIFSLFIVILMIFFLKKKTNKILASF